MFVQRFAALLVIIATLILLSSAAFAADTATTAGSVVLLQNGQAPVPRIYVDADSAGSGSGLDWENAFQSLADGLAAAAAASSHEVWVAGGTYYGPLTIPVGVAVYGGFAGTEANLSERILGANETIVVGGLTFEPGGWTRNPANGHFYRLTDSMTWTDAEAAAVSLGGHLVTINDAQENAWVASVFIWYDYCWIGLSDAAEEGTWQWVSGQTPAYTNWDSGQPDNNWEEDYAEMWGGGMWNDLSGDAQLLGLVEHDGDSSTVVSALDGLTIQGSSSWGIECIDVSPDVRNCTIRNNPQGGVHCYNGSSTFTNCSIEMNGNYGLLADTHAIVSVTDCTISGNSDYGVYANYYSDITINRCMITANGTGVSSYTTSDLVISSSYVSGNYWGGIFCNNSSPEIINCIISGNGGSNAYYYYYYYGIDAPGIHCYYASPIITNCTISGNSASGVQCNSSSAPVLTNTILNDNGEYGIYRQSTSAAPVVRYCLFSDNAGGDYYDVGSIYYGANDINMNVAGASNNFSGSPMYAMGATGTWTSDPAYDLATNRTTLTDSAASFVAGSLVGRLVNPATSTWVQALIVANTDTTLVVVGDFSSVVSVGDPYQVLDYHLADGSSALDKADEASAPSQDFDGDPRPGGDALVDLGADEAASSYVPGPDTQLPVSTVTEMAAARTTASFAVPYLASDAESGVQYVRLFYRKSGGAWTQYGGDYTSSPIDFDTSATGGDGRYDFYTVATDNGDNAETAPPEPDATTLVMTSFAGPRLYVGPEGTGSELGSGWEDPIWDLQAAAMVAGAFSVPELWVMEGTHGPVVVPVGVVLYGGFAGTETDPAQRDLSTHQSTIEGGVVFEPHDDHSDTIEGATPIGFGYITGVLETLDDVDCFSFSATAGSTYYLYNNNYLHIELCLPDGTVDSSWDDWYMSAVCTVSGTYYFKVSGSDVGPYTLELEGDGGEGEGEGEGETDGQAAVLDGFTVTGSPDYGLTCVYASPDVRNCIIEHNSEGGVYCEMASPTLTACRLSFNGPYGVNCYNSGSPIITNCTITTSDYGVAVHSSSVVLTGCTIADNGIGVAGWNSSGALSGNIISGNEGVGVQCEDYFSPSIDNCIISGNGSVWNYWYYYYSNEAAGIYCYYYADPVITNCTISGNSGSGIAYSYNAHPTAANTILEGNGAYGIEETYYYNSECDVENCLFMNNTEGDYYDMQTGAYVGANDINMFLPGTANNFSGDPSFIHGDVGEWTSAPIYDEETGMSTLTNTTAAFVPGALVGQLVNPATSQLGQSLIAANTATTLVVFGDVGSFVSAGDPYQIMDYHLLDASNALDKANPAYAPEADIDGDARPGDDALFDIGADEADSAFLPAEDVLPPVSEVHNLPRGHTTPEFSVPYLASDAESGVLNVRLFYRRTGGDWTQYGDTYTSSPITFDTSTTGGDDRYDFYTVVTDLWDNIEAAPTEPDATTLVVTSFSGTHMYVGMGGTDDELGEGWDSPYRDLTAALTFASAFSVPEVWVSGGAYDGSVLVPVGVTVYGGFAGTETDPAQRQIDANSTVITGGVTFEPHDDHGDTPADATPITSEYVTGVFETLDDVDCFSFSAIAGQLYYAYNYYNYLTMQLCRSDGTVEFTSADWYIYWECPVSGTYYLKVSGSQVGPYGFEVWGSEGEGEGEGEGETPQLPEAVLDGVTITGSEGWGITCMYASPHVNNCIITGNESGGIHVSLAAPVVTDCVIADNGNAGIFCESGSDADISGCSVSGHNYGIRLYNSGSASVTGCSIFDNNSYGIYADWYCVVDVTRCTLAGNGTGVRAYGAEAVLAQSVVSGNLWANIEFEYCSPLVSNCIVSGAGGYYYYYYYYSEGTGIQCYSASPTIVNCTVSGNAASGLLCNYGSSPVVTNTIIERNGGYGVYESYSNADPVVQYCLFEANTEADYLDNETGAHTGADAINLNVAGAANNIGGDPLYAMGAVGVWSSAPLYDEETRRTTLVDSSTSFEPGSLAGWMMNPATSQYRQLLVESNTATAVVVVGDATDFVAEGDTYQIIDYHLLNGSVCIDTGTDTGAPVMDLDDNPRPIDIIGLEPDATGTEFDIGAYEFPGGGSLIIIPSGGLLSEGSVGGPFTPSSIELLLQNMGEVPLVWTAEWLQSWLNVSSNGGTLAPGASITLEISLGPGANSLPSGTYQDNVVITDVAAAVAQTRHVLLHVRTDYFTELFDAGDNDLDYQTLTFTPNGSANFYAVSRTTAASFPTDPAGGTPLSLWGDDFAMVTLAGGAQVSLYGVSYISFFVGSNGYITFTEGDWNNWPTLDNHFSLPRISALFDDLNPSAGGTVSWRQLSNRVAVTFENIPRYWSIGSNSFQIELFFNGIIRITHLQIDDAGGLAGLSEGFGTPEDFYESDLSAYQTLPRYPATVYLGNTIETTALPYTWCDYQLDLDPGDAANLLVRLTPLDGPGTWRLLGRRNELPTLTLYDWITPASTAPTPRELLIPAPGAGSFFFSVYYSELGQFIPRQFRLEIIGVNRYLSSTSVSSGGNVGAVTVQLAGLGFESGVRVELRDSEGATLLTAYPTSFDGTSLIVTLDLTDLLPQAANIVVVWPDDYEEMLPDAFTIIGGIGPRLDARLVVPDQVRPDRTYTLWLEYENTGDTDMPAPLFVVSSPQNVPMRLFSTDPYQDASIQLLGLSPVAPVEVLPPRAANRIPVQFIAASLDDIEFNLARLTADNTPIDWDEIGSLVQVADLDPEVWGRLWPVLTPQLGDTSADYHAVLLADAGYLGSLGRTVYSVRDLFSFEIRKALGMIPRGYLAAGFDAFCPAPGLSLSFARVFQGRLDQRLYLGPLGRGWTHTFDVYLVDLDEDNVLLHDMTGFTRFFHRNTDGTWSSSLGDHGKLHSSSGAFTLTEADKTLYRFRSDLKLDYIEDLNGNRITAAYDGDDRLITISHTSGDQLELTYDGSGRLVSLTDHAGRVTTYEYDGEQLATVTAPGGQTAVYDYAAETGGPGDYALLSITYSDGAHQYYEYDALGRLSREYLDGEAESVTYEYGSLGHVTVRDAAGAATTLSPDEYGRPGLMTDALGRTASMTYGAGFTLSTVDNPAGGVTRFEYDHLGNVVLMEDALGNVIRFAYDYRFNSLTSAQDTLGNVTTFAYDDAGKMTGITRADGTSESYSFDTSGSIGSVGNRRGDVVTYTCNARGQVVAKDFPDGHHASYTYDDAGRLITATDASGTIALTYDDRGLLTHIAYPSGHWFNFEYNQLGQRTRRVGEDGYTVNYVYDGAARLESVTDGEGAAFIQYQYNDRGQVIAEYNGNGAYKTYAYDDAGQIVSLFSYLPDDSVNAKFEYTYDANGNPTSMTTLEGTTEYQYDAMGRLIGVAYPDASCTDYEYDSAGNRLAVTDDGILASYTTNNMNQYTQVGGAILTYDEDGNLTSMTTVEGTTTYEYDYENRLIGQTGPGAETWEYGYDALGNRVTVVHNGSETQYVHDPAGWTSVAAEYRGESTSPIRYIYGLGLVAHEDTEGAEFYYVFNAAGHTCALTDGTGEEVAGFNYDPFGVLRQQLGTATTALRYAGRFGVISDSDAMLFMRNRYYRPAEGRFVQEDPAGLAAGLNAYAYCRNNPVKYVDPDGLIESITADLPTTLLFFLLYEPIYDSSGREIEPAGQAGSLLEKFQYGNWGGSRWSGGEWIKPGELGDLRVPGTDWLDDVFKYHDQAMLKGLPHPTNNAQDVLLLAAQILKLDPSMEKRVRDITTALSSDLDVKKALEQLNKILTDLIRPVDPNEKVGPAGTGDLRSIGVNDQLGYIIYFENDPEAGATAPAQEVVVTDYLDTDLDWSTFRITEIGWGAYTVDVPADTAAYSTRVTIADYRPDVDKDWWVDVAVAIDYGTGLVEWTFRTLDPNTDDLPEDVLAGFLPVNDDTRRGEGHVAFTIKPKADATPSTRIDNQASISFDTNAPIVTNEVFNTITGDNRPPLLVNPGDRNTAEGASVRLELHAEDPDGNELTYAGAGLPPGLTLGASTGIVTGNLSYTTAGVYTPIVTVSDGALTDAKTFTWTVSNTNQAPAVTNPGNQTGVEGATVSLPVVATDADGDALAYTADGLPPGLGINELTGVISGTLDYSSAGLHNVAVSASDGYLSDSKSFTWTVTETNLPPVVANPGSQSSAEGASVSLPVTATDPDGTPLSFSATGLPADLSINPTTGVVSGTLGYNAAGVYSVTVTASDGSLSDSETFGWTVTNTDRAPIVTNPGSQTDAEGDVVSLQTAATDPDGDTLVYSATGLPPGLTINASTGVISGTLAFNAAGGHSVTVSASDGMLSDSETFAWNVSNTNRPPVLANPGNQTHAEGATISLQIAATDPDGDNLVFDATGLPDGLSIDPAAGLITGTLATDGNYNPTVSVSDGDLSDSESFTWTVHSEDEPPVLTNPGDQSSAEGETVSLQVVANDLDQDTLAYSATGLPGGLDINPSTGLISGVIGFNAAGNHNVTLTVSDGTLNDSETFEWTVTNTNRPPVLTNPGNQAHAEGASISLQVVATDPDGDPITYGATGLPADLAINPSTGLISGAMGFDAAGNHTVSLTVSDGTLNDSETFHWNVTNTNRPPNVTNPGNQTHPEGANVSVQVVANDPDGDILTYTASNLPPSLDIDPATGLISGVVGSTAANDYAVTIIVSDGQQNSEAEFTWTITPAGDDDGGGGGGCFGGSIGKTSNTRFRGDTLLLGMTSLALVIVAGKRRHFAQQEA